MTEFFQMKRQRRRRQTQPFGDDAGRKAFVACSNQQAVYGEARFMHQRTQGSYGIFSFHLSNKMKNENSSIN